MVAVMGNIRFAIFVVLSPVMLIGNHFDRKRRNKKASRKETARFAEDLAAFEAELDQAVAEERHRRELAWPPPAEICRRPALPATRLWERRDPADAFLVLRIASGPPPSDPPVPTPAPKPHPDRNRLR